MKNILRIFTIVLALGAAIQLVSQAMADDKANSKAEKSDKSDKSTKPEKRDLGIIKILKDNPDPGI